MLQWFPAAYDTGAVQNTVVRKLILCSTSTATYMNENDYVACGKL